jgi:hypothetical protein
MDHCQLCSHADAEGWIAINLSASQTRAGHSLKKHLYPRRSRHSQALLCEKKVFFDVGLMLLDVAPCHIAAS